MSNLTPTLWCRRQPLQIAQKVDAADEWAWAQQEGAMREAELDLQLAEEWFPLEEEAWRERS